MGKGATQLKFPSDGSSRGEAGTIEFGKFSTQTPSTASEALFAGRTSRGEAGTLIAVEVSAKMSFSGGSTGVIKLSRKYPAGGFPDVPSAHLRVAVPGLGRPWASATDGTAVPEPGDFVNVCPGRCNSDEFYRHELAVFIPDTQAAGAFSAVLTYEATAL